MLDATKASLFFARGVILVEGISEVLLFPVLANRIGCSLEDAAVSIVPVFGVDFRTIARMFGAQKLTTPLAIVTDADPGRVFDSSSGIHLPAKDESGNVLLSQRVASLQSEFAGEPSIQVFPSTVTLEYDLAAAGPDNPTVLCDAWENCFVGTPKKLNSAGLTKLVHHQSKVSAIWTEICYESTTRGKGEFAQSLAEVLSACAEDGSFSCPKFVIPPYIENAIRFVTKTNAANA